MPHRTISDPSDPLDRDPDTLAPSSALPIGVTFDSSDTQLTAVDPTTTRLSELTGQVLALLQAPDDTSDEEKAKSPVLGFIHLYVPSFFSA